MCIHYTYDFTCGHVSNAKAILPCKARFGANLKRCTPMYKVLHNVAQTPHGACYSCEKMIPKDADVFRDLPDRTVKASHEQQADHTLRHDGDMEQKSDQGKDWTRA